jgi:hypothetical protein
VVKIRGEGWNKGEERWGEREWNVKPAGKQNTCLEKHTIVKDCRRIERLTIIEEECRINQQ